MTGITHKICSKCKKDQNIDQFHADIRYKDGYMGVCRTCRRENTRRYIQLHPEYRIRMKHFQEEHRKSKQILNDADKIIGGYKVYISNYVKSGEYKFNIVPTKGELFKTNDFSSFIRYLKNLFETKM